MWGTVLLLYFVSGCHLLSIPDFSVPSAVEFGENVTLKCKYELNAGESDNSLFVKWWWTPLNGTSEDRLHLYQRIAGYSPEVTRNDIGIIENDNILLLNVTPEDSGTYECEVSNIDEVRKRSDLVVYKLGSGPKLNITVNVTDDGPDEDLEEDVLVVVECTASDVAPEPDLIITINGNIVESETMLDESEDNTYDISESVVLNKEDANEAEITCKLVIDKANITHPHVDTETFAYPSALTTTEIAEDVSTTEASSDPLQNTNAGLVSTPCALLVIATFLFQFFTKQ